MPSARYAAILVAPLAACQLLLNTEPEQAASTPDASADAAVSDAPLDGAVAVDADADVADGDAGTTFVLASATNPREVAMDDTDVYWVADSADGGVRIEHAPKAGGAVSISVEGEPTIGRIGVKDQYVYYAAGPLKRVPKNKIVGPDFVFESGKRFLTSAFAFSGDRTYITEDMDAGSVWACSGDPCGDAGMLPNLQLVSPKTITVANGALFVSDGVKPPTYEAQLRRVNPGDGSVSTIALWPMAYSVTDGKTLYFTFGDDRNHVLRVALDAPEVTSTTPVADVVAQGSGPARQLAVDTTHLYWITDGSPGFLHRVKLGGSTVETLVDDVRKGGGLAVDDRMVCWSEAERGQIRCLMK